MASQPNEVPTYPSLYFELDGPAVLVCVGSLKIAMIQSAGILKGTEYVKCKGISRVIGAIGSPTSDYGGAAPYNGLSTDTTWEAENTSAFQRLNKDQQANRDRLVGVAPVFADGIVLVFGY